MLLDTVQSSPRSPLRNEVGVDWQVLGKEEGTCEKEKRAGGGLSQGGMLSTGGSKGLCLSAHLGGRAG